jgi:hypothetical protein
MHALRGADQARRLTAHNWLLEAAPHRHTAGMEWTSNHVALLKAGVTWDVVRVPYAVLDRTFDRDTEPAALLRWLEAAEVGGAVFCDPYRPYMYVMVPPGTDRSWKRDLAPAGVECLGGTQPYIHHVGVPRIDCVEPPRPFWVLSPDAGRRHADADHLYKVLETCVRVTA